MDKSGDDDKKGVSITNERKSVSHDPARSYPTDPELTALGSVIFPIPPGI